MNTNTEQDRWKLDDKPVDVRWTDAQWRAISLTGGNILVSAAAGSGKTAVLVERIVRRVVDPTDPAEIDRLLVVTFTNAAAAEMNVRIGERIDDALKENPGSLYLQRQRQLLNKSHISTLHSFCNDVIRHYYYEANIDPNVRVANDTEREILKDEVLDELLEDYYGSHDEQFFGLVDAYSGDRSDDGLRKLLLNVYTQAQSQPEPDVWLEKMAAMYEYPYENVEDTPWGKSLQAYAHEQAQVAVDALHHALILAEYPDGPGKYVDVLTNEKQMLTRLMERRTWHDWHATLKNFSPQTMPKKDKDADDTIAKQSKGYRDEAKEIIKELKRLFSPDPARHLEKIDAMKEHVRLIVTLVQQFAARYAEIKREKTLVDYEDLEHLTLHILRGETLDTPSPVARAYQDYFTEILTDEYQDTNRVQEAILHLLSDGRNRFMVGDVKQSIYRFRLAEPSLFLEKQRHYQTLGNEDVQSIKSDGIRIDLIENFRSRKQVLDGVNFVFKQVMDESTGDVHYNESQMLRYGNVDYETNAQGFENELILLEETNEKDDEDLHAAEKEGQWIAEKIQSMIKNRFPVYDKALGGTRSVEYRDITILMRSKQDMSTFMDQFKQAGIPTYADQSGGYFQRIEVQVMMALLRVIDNPYQDIPLASVLRSPIVGLRENELSEIRLAGKGEPFYEAMKNVVRDQPVLPTDAKLFFMEAKQRAGGEWRNRVAAFYAHLQKWRSQARNHSLSQLIWDLFRETGYDAFVGGLPGGKERQANLHALYDRARAYEQTSFRGLFRFLRFIDRMAERGDDLEVARTLGEQENVVKIMSIHKSKGLEFPVLFVARMAKQFNLKDAHSSIQIHQSLGFGSKYMDIDKRATYQTLPLLAMKQAVRKEQISEEMRILYVAITRAKEKAFLVGIAKDREKMIEEWMNKAITEEARLPLQTRTRAKTFFDWLGPAVIRHPAASTIRSHVEETSASVSILTDESEWHVDLLDPRGYLAEEASGKKMDATLARLQALKTVDVLPTDDATLVNQRLDWTYSRPLATMHFAKQSVSEIKRLHDNEDPYAAKAMQNHHFQSAYAARPRFMQERKGSLTRAEIGTAMHTLMQRIPLHVETIAHIEAIIADMVEKEQFSDMQANAIDVTAVLRFFQSELGKRLKRSSHVYREVPFTFVKPAAQIYSDWQEEEQEEILIQGVADCLFREKDRLILIDYKTDQIQNGMTHNMLRQRYQEQIRLYSEAIEKIWKIKVNERYLYFFDSDDTVSM